MVSDMHREYVHKLLFNGFIVVDKESRFNWIKLRFEFRYLSLKHGSDDFQPITGWMTARESRIMFTALRKETNKIILE